MPELLGAFSPRLTSEERKYIITCRTELCQPNLLSCDDAVNDSNLPVSFLFLYWSHHGYSIALSRCQGPLAAPFEMFARRVGVQAFRCCVKRPTVVSRATARKFSTPSLAPSDASAAAAHPLVGVTTQFDHVAPRFEIDPSKIEILSSPSAYYETVKVVPEKYSLWELC